MSRLRIAVIAVALAVAGVLPAAARATVTSSQISTWTSSQPGTPANGTYLISFDNPPTPTTLAVTGTASAAAGDHVDIVCYFGPSNSGQFKTLESGLLVAANGSFATGSSPPQLRQIAGHACRLRAIPSGTEGTSDSSVFAGPQVAVSEAALPLSTISGGTVNPGKPYNYYVNDVTLTGWAGWKAVGTNGCGPYAAPIDQTFSVGNFAIDCAGSLLADDLGVWGGRSEVQIDGRNAYDAASAQALIPRTGALNNGSQDLPGFPSLTAAVNFDPSTGLVSSRSQESWAACAGSDPYKPTVIARDCPSFVATGMTLERDIATSDGGRVVTMTDTWSSTDGNDHTVDALYDDYVGLSASSDVRGYEFPGQSTFDSYVDGDQLPGPSAAPGSIFVHTDVHASDGNPGQAFGAITFSTAPSGFRFAPLPPTPGTTTPSSNEIEEHNVVSVPANGSASLTYVYSVGYSLADVSGQALTSQGQFQPPAVRITSPGNGAATSTPTVTVAGTATAGAGIKSLVVAGQAVSVAPDGTWSAQAALSPGSNTIAALVTDEAGATAHAQVTVFYESPSPSPSPSASLPVRCHVPSIKGMKLTKARRALRRTHCRVGKLKHVKSRKIGRGRVVTTTPRAGQHLAAGSTVEVFVSKGR